MERDPTTARTDSATSDVLAIMGRRRTVRRFDPDRPVADSVLRLILEQASLAPSPFNLQPWRFLVVRVPGNRRRLRRCAGNQPRITEAPAVIVLLAEQGGSLPHLDAILERGIQSGALTPSTAAELRGRALAAHANRDDPDDWAARIAMLAAGTLMLVAEALGVGTALLDVPADEPLRAAFGIPDDHRICGLIALGYAAELAAFPGRLDLDELCHGEHFGSPLRLDDE